MPQLFLDGHALDSTLDDGATLAAAVQSARGRLEGRAIIMGIACDGRDVAPDALPAMLPRPLADFHRVDLTSGDASEAVIEALSETRLAILDTYAAVQQAADDLSAGNIARGMNALIDCVDTWARVHEAIVNGGQLLRLDFERLVLSGRPLLDWLGDLNRKLRDVKNAVEQQDHVLLADILRYEMDETLQRWEDMLTALIAHVRTTARAGN